MSSPSVFISSTYDDLKNIRLDVSEYLKTLGYTPRLFERGGIGFQSNEPLDKDCIDAVVDSDIFILLLGKRYGSPQSDSRKNAKRFKSISRVEFEAAANENIPLFVFVEKSVSSAYKTFEENDYSTEIAYNGVEDVQSLIFLKKIYAKYGRKNFVNTFENSNDITQVLKQQFASVVKDWAKRYRAKKKDSNQTKINALRLWYEMSVTKKFSKKKVADGTAITEMRLTNLLKMKWSEKRVISAGCFPKCSHEELSKLEKFLDCEGQLRVGQKQDFQHLYLNTYCKHFRKPVANKYPNKFSRSGFKVETIIFDFDGTMTSNQLTTWEVIWDLLGYPADLCSKYHRSFRRGDITHEEWCNITMEKFRERNFSREQLSSIAGKMLLRDGLRDVIHKLHDEGHRLHIVSGSIQQVIELTLKDSYRCFNKISANHMHFDKSGIISKIQGTKFDFENKSKYITKRIIPDEDLHPLEILYIGNSSNDVWVSNSGVRTLCVDPKLTDPDERTFWGDKIQNFVSGDQILEHVYKGSHEL